MKRNKRGWGRKKLKENSFIVPNPFYLIKFTHTNTYIIDTST